MFGGRTVPSRVRSGLALGPMTAVDGWVISWPEHGVPTYLPTALPCCRPACTYLYTSLTPGGCVLPFPPPSASLANCLSTTSDLFVSEVAHSQSAPQTGAKKGRPRKKQHADCSFSFQLIWCSPQHKHLHSKSIPRLGEHPLQLII